MTEELHAVQDAMRLKDAEIERLQSEIQDMVTVFGRNPRGSQAPTMEVKSGLDINPSGMNMNIELQAKMIEELLVKNAQLADENVQA